MRVLYISQYTQLYGANRSLLQLILELREKGVSPEVLLPPSSDGISEMANELKLLHIPFIETPIRSVKHLVWWKTIPNYLLAKRQNKDILEKLKDRKYDIIHTNCSIITVGKDIAKKIGAKHVWHLREYGDLDYNLKSPFGKWFQRIIYSGNNHFIAISKSVRSHYQPYLSGQFTHLVYNGIKPIDPIVRDWDKDKIEICIVGLVHVNKGQLELLKAVDELVNNMDIRGFRVNVIGSGDINYIKELEDYVKGHDLEAYVKFWGYRNDVSKILKTQDIGVMASSHEAFGRTTVEYMMAGLGVIVSDSGANREIVEDGESGLIYPSGDYKALAEQLAKFQTDRESLKRISLNGMKRALDKFSSIANSDNIFDIYQKILNQV